MNVKISLAKGVQSCCNNDIHHEINFQRTINGFQEMNGNSISLLHTSLYTVFEQLKDNFRKLINYSHDLDYIKTSLHRLYDAILRTCSIDLLIDKDIFFVKVSIITETQPLTYFISYLSNWFSYFSYRLTFLKSISAFNELYKLTIFLLYKEDQKIFNFYEPINCNQVFIVINTLNNGY